jgi:hypothetical protein
LWRARRLDEPPSLRGAKIPFIRAKRRRWLQSGANVHFIRAEKSIFCVRVLSQVHLGTSFFIFGGSDGKSGALWHLIHHLIGPMGSHDFIAE